MLDYRQDNRLKRKHVMLGRSETSKNPRIESKPKL
jgi:hypothetical protein